MATSDESIRTTLRQLSRKVNELATIIFRLEKTMLLIGEQNFQIRAVLSEVASEQARTLEELSECSGKIQGSSWMEM